MPGHNAQRPDLVRSGPKLLLGLFLAAALLRLYPLLTSTYIWDEEREWIVLARKISFRLENLHLPIREGHHPSLPAYLIRAGSWLFGSTPIGYRFFSLAAGLLTLFILWRLAARWAGPAAALWSLLLLAFNEYHVGISIFATEKSFQHLFVALSLLGFYRYLAGEGTRFLYWSAATAGLAFLCNERSVLLGAVYGVALIWSQGLSWLRRRETYLALALFLLMISPDLHAHLRCSGSCAGVSYWDHLSRAGSVGLNRHYLLFFGRDEVAYVYNLLGVKLHDQAPEYPAMNMLFGMLLLAVVAISWRHFRSQDAGGKLFLSAFTVVLVFFSSVRPGAVPPGLDPVAWFWVDLSLPAAVLLSGPVLARQGGILRRPLLALAGLGVLWAGYSVWGGRLPLERITAAATPELLWPADGRWQEVRILFNVCALCKPARVVELVEVFADAGGGPADIEGANPGTDDRTFRVRAAPPGGPSRVYTALYRVPDYFGAVRTVEAKIFAPVHLDRPWPARFWMQSPDRPNESE